MKKILTRPKVDGQKEITLSGSKSIANRALVIAALSDGKSVLENFSESDDAALLRKAFEKLGVQIEGNGSTLQIQGAGLNLHPFHGEIDVGPAGTTMRFLTAVLASIPGCRVELRGSERMHQRPISPLVDALRTLGAEIQYLGREGCPPLLIEGKELLGGKPVTLDGGISSQYFTALLLIAPILRGGLILEVEGQQISKSYIDITIDVLRSFGVSVANEGYQRYTVDSSAQYTPRSYLVEGDASGASYLWGAGALGSAPVRVLGISSESVQGDAKFPGILRDMGAEVTNGTNADGRPWIEVRRLGPLKGVSVDMEDLPDTAQTLAVIAANAEGTTRITGLSTLRIKETDRIDAVVTELQKVGITAKGGDDWLEITGGKVKSGGEISTYDDHRMAMAFSLLAFQCDTVAIRDAEVVSKSFPTYWKVWEECFGGIS